MGGAKLEKLMANGAKKFSTGVHGSEDAATAAHQQDGALTWLKSRKRDGRGWHRAGLFGKTLEDTLATITSSVTSKTEC